VRAHVDRILATDAAKTNLHDAMMSYFAIQALETIVVQDPTFTNAVRSSMYHESDLFLRNTLWGGKLAELLTRRSRRSTRRWRRSTASPGRRRA
jgi:predicted RNA-binding protein with PIN domain